jgi:hypothetical protein
MKKSVRVAQHTFSPPDIRGAIHDVRGRHGALARSATDELNFGIAIERSSAEA